MMGTYIDPNCDLPIFAMARRTDPPTSHEAGERARSFAGDHRDRILAALKAGPAGKTEIGRRCGLTEQQVARRMHELARAGRVVADGTAVSESGGRETRWRLAQ